MKKSAISRSAHIAIVALVLAFMAIGASCMRETAKISDQPLSSCVVFADYDVSDAASHQGFDATFADYAHLLDGTVSEDDILNHRRQRLDSLDQLKQHYLRTFARELPPLVKDTLAPNWNEWTEWRVFSDRFRQGDELWHFALPASDAHRHGLRRGYAIIREGKLHAMLLNRTVVFGARYADYESLLKGVATESQILAWKQQRFDSLEAIGQHYGAQFGPDSSRILLEPRCRLGGSGGPLTKWDHWHVFGRNYRAGDQLWYFESPAASWTGPTGRCGYLILRDGQLHAILVVAIS